MKERIHPKIEVVHLSPNFSTRGGARPTLIVIHATVSHNVKGLGDLKAIGDFFARTATQASSHVCTDNEGNSARYVRDANKAWHCANYNRLSLGIEQVLPATGAELTDHLYQETARWVAHWGKHYCIPIRMGRVSGLSVVKSGVVTHKSLGSLGGGHVDPGVYDMEKMMHHARVYRKRL